MRPAALVALGIAAYLAFLLATMPASFVAARVSVPGVRIEAARGTLWNGQARARIATGTGALELDDVHWQWRASRVLAGRLAWHVQATSPALFAQAQVERGIATLELRELQARGDAAALAPLVPLLAAWRPEGGVRLASPRIAWDGRQLRGDARLEWTQAALAISAVHPLGSYRVDARAAGGPAEFQLSTLEGPLRIAGHGTFEAPGAFTFSGDARAEGPSSAALQPLLDLLGPRRADGARALEWHAANARISRPS